MSFSRMKPTAYSLSKALIVGVAFGAGALAFVGRSSAEPIYGNDGGGSSKTKVSYAQELSQIKEQIAAKQEELDEKQDELDTEQKNLNDLKKYNSSWDNSQG